MSPFSHGEGWTHSGRWERGETCYQVSYWLCSAYTAVAGGPTCAPLGRNPKNEDVNKVRVNNNADGIRWLCFFFLVEGVDAFVPRVRWFFPHDVWFFTPLLLLQ